MCGYFCNEFMLKGKSLLDYTNLFSRNYYENDKIIVFNFVNSVWPSGRFSLCLLITLSSINMPS